MPPIAHSVLYIRRDVPCEVSPLELGLSRAGIRTCPTHGCTRVPRPLGTQSLSSRDLWSEGEVSVTGCLRMNVSGILFVLENEMSLKFSFGKPGSEKQTLC